MFKPAKDWNSEIALDIASSEMIPPLVGFAGGKYPNCDRYLCNAKQIRSLLYLHQCFAILRRIDPLTLSQTNY